MRQRIIQVDHENTNEVLLQIDRDTENDSDFVRISCWHDFEGQPFYHDTKVIFHTENYDVDAQMKAFIRDYSPESALAFAKAFKQ
jgi:hypothetical protein